MDKETQKIVGEQKTIKSLLGHEGWGIARQKFVDKVAELQNAFNIEDSTPEEMVRDLKARKLATDILFEFLRDIEGSASVANEHDSLLKKYVVNLD